MSLKVSSVSKCLDKKLLIFGYEIPDIIAVLIVLAVLNFFFGATNQKIILIWLPVIALAITLRIGKRGKPDNYLIHLIKFKVRPKRLVAFPDPSQNPFPPKRNRR